MSRARSASARGSSTRTSARPGVFVQTPRSDVYVAMLGVALGAMVLGCLLLILILGRYGFQTKASALWPAPTTALAARCEKSVIPGTVHL